MHVCCDMDECLVFMYEVCVCMMWYVRIAMLYVTVMYVCMCVYVCYERMYVCYVCNVSACF